MDIGTKEAFEKELKNKLAMKASGHVTEETVLLKAFKYFDLDNSGECSLSEFLNAVSKIGITGFSEKKLTDIFYSYDIDGNGELNYKEFIGAIFGNESEQNEQEPNQTPKKPKEKKKLKKREKFVQPKEREKKPKKFSGQKEVLGKKSKKEYLDSDEVTEIMQKIRSKMATRGVRGIISIARSFKIMDDDNSNSIDFEEFTKACKDYRFGLTDDEVEKAFVAFDLDGNGTIEYDEFLKAVRGKMNNNRKKIVRQAFDKLDKDGNGVLEISDLKGVYNARRHPEVLAGRKTEDDILMEFLETFETAHNLMCGTENDGTVTFEEFCEYYENVSMSIDDDEYFKVMMENAWKLGKDDYSNKKGWSNKVREAPSVSDNYNKNKLHGKPYQKPPAKKESESEEESEEEEEEESEEEDQRKPMRTVPNNPSKRSIREDNNNYSNTKKPTPGPKTASNKKNNYDEPKKIEAYRNAPFGVDDEPVNYSTSYNTKGSKKNNDDDYGSKKSIQFSKKGPEVIKRFREAVSRRGIRGIMSIRRAFLIADDDNSKTIDERELAKFCHDYRMNFNEKEVKELFKFFDADKNGEIDYDEFISGVVGEMNDFRMELVKKVFNKLDIDHNGFIEVDDIRDIYNAKKHPDVISGKKTEDEILAEWLDTFEYHFNLLNNNETKDQRVSLDEFISYYNNISMSIPDDNYFEVMISNAWGLNKQQKYPKGWRGD